ncbi:TetR/AcrR family transcriptional regulator [Bacterioplanoides sp. SCSIO 12839]|uniref:TetR/AcrR family transcriptional regulator n=1 Tax=Bacterioplanoides sp. SCSIO 12839 TaxID=2829569 RepID=UPI00210813AB|nr:TetR/AcrR family transcriptional regulator [Bacterioplanoides sp. SCSIO 12839]UTW48113.1 TetR family transcriptional regulator [Bacterioplanoides sp. SCSIO 12839]
MTVVQKLIEAGQITDPKTAKGRLLVAAARLFKNKGYERTTVRDLASEIGIQSGSLFHHYKSKEAILQAVMEETIALNMALMRDAIADVNNPRDKVLALIRCELRSILGDTGEAMSVLVYEWRSLKPDSQKHILALRDAYEQLWLDTLEEAREADMVQIEPFILRRFLTGALSWTTNWYKPDGEMTLEQLAEDALQLAIK